MAPLNTRTPRNTRSTIAALIAIAGLGMTLHAAEPEMVGDEVIIVESTSAAGTGSSTGAASPTATNTNTNTHTMTFVSQATGGPEVRVEVRDGHRRVWVNDDAIDKRLLRERDGRLDVLDASGAVIATIDIATQPGAHANAPSRQTALLPAKIVQRQRTTVDRSERSDTPAPVAQRRVILGITMSEPGPALRAQLRLDTDTPAVVIDSVIDGYPASKAGLKPFDVVLGFDESGLVKAISEKRSGDEMTLRVLSAGEKREIRVVFDRPANEASAVEIVLNPAPDRSGWVKGPSVPVPPGAQGDPASPRITVLPDGFATWFVQNQGDFQQQRETMERTVRESIEQAMAALAEAEIDESVRARTRDSMESVITQFRERMGAINPANPGDANDQQRFGGLAGLRAMLARNGDANTDVDIQVFDPDRGDMLRFPAATPSRVQIEVEKQRAVEMEARFESLEATIDARLSALEARMDAQLKRFAAMMERMEGRGR